MKKFSHSGRQNLGCREWGVTGRNLPLPPLYARTPFLPQAGAGHFVQTPVYTPVPLQRSLGELPLSPLVFKLLPTPLLSAPHLQPVTQ